jgi:hypothetical protein
MIDRKANQRLPTHSLCADASTCKRYAVLRSQTSRPGDLLEEAENLASLRPRAPSIKDRLTRARNRASGATVDRLDSAAGFVATPLPVWLPLAVERSPRLR